uniref:Uncharacterized protein n=1 Tax=Glossina palpalis gambiensis TaxID=67801 RepID=A0A1B0AXV8_9MUSC
MTNTKFFKHIANGSYSRSASSMNDVNLVYSVLCTITSFNAMNNNITGVFLLVIHIERRRKHKKKNWFTILSNILSAVENSFQHHFAIDNFYESNFALSRRQLLRESEPFSLGKIPPSFSFNLNHLVRMRSEKCGRRRHYPIIWS